MQRGKYPAELVHWDHVDYHLLWCHMDREMDAPRRLDDVTTQNDILVLQSFQSNVRYHWMGKGALVRHALAKRSFLLFLCVGPINH